MQRVRLGLTGLAFVFILVLIAAAGMRPGRSLAPAHTQGETLAVLGVAPGTVPDATPPAAAPPARKPAERAPAAPL